MHHVHFSAHLVIGMYLGVEHSCRLDGDNYVADGVPEALDAHGARRLTVWALAPLYAEMMALNRDDDPEAVALALKSSHEPFAFTLCARYGLDIHELGASTIRVVRQVWPQIQQAADCWTATGGAICEAKRLELEHALLSEAA